MKLLKAKSVLFLCIVLAIFYFTNDFAIISLWPRTKAMPKRNSCLASAI